METCKKNFSFIYFGFFMFLFSQVSYVSSETDTISTKTPLIAYQTIVSSSDIFELGLFNSGNDHFFIGMWYKQVSPRTIVWVANREFPALVDDYNSLGIIDGNLILYDTLNNETIWSTGVNSSRSKDVQAVLLDNGNLVLRDGPTVLWQSFDHPSDTWLPEAKLRVNIKLGSHRLTSWKSLKDPSPGQYSLEVDPNTRHSLINYWNGSKSYWSSGPLDDFNGFPYSDSNLRFKLNLDESYITYSIDLNSTYRLVMDVSGRFILQVWYDDIKSWIERWYQTEYRCEVYNFCGSFGICNETELMPCRCVPGFRPAFPNDFSSGCARETELQCGKGTDEFLPMKNMKFATDPTTTLVLTASSVTRCASACLANCSCNAYAYDGNKCLMWTRGAFNLQQLDANNIDGQTFFLRLAASNISTTTSKLGRTKDPKVRSMVLPVVLSSLVGAAAFFIGLYCCISTRRRRKRTQRDEKESKEILECGGIIDDDGENMCYLNLHDIMAATNAFSEENKLGEGGFGPVYKVII